MNDKSVHTHVKPSSEVPKSMSSFGKFWQWLINWPIKIEQETDTHQLLYYTPGKVLWHIERQNDRTLRDEQLAQDIREFLTPKEPNENPQYSWTNKLLPPNPEAIITFPPQENSTSVFSVVSLFMKDQLAGNKELETLLINIDNDLKDDDLKDRPLTIGTGTTLNSVSPDWLIGGAGHGGPHPPSPGSWPRQARFPTSDQQKIWLIQDKPDKTPEQNTIGLPFSERLGKGIDIAILDTAPLQVTRDEAYQRWKGNKDPLLEDLLGPNSQLTVHTGINADVELADYHPVGHRYHGMENHGLFIAGIIHSIAPDANLHLFKAFTSHGSGSCESIAGGLNQIIQMFRNPKDTPEQREKWRPLVVNCSFALSLNDDNQDLPEKIKAMRKLFERLFKRLTDEEKVIVVAAAGNYIDDPYHPVTSRPPTDYPAAFKNVLAVGALPKASSITPTEFKAATYSNRSNDNDPDEGFMAFGGEPGDGDGVQGLYISEFPAYNEGCLSYLWRKLTGTGLDGWKGPGHIPPNPRGLPLNRIRYDEPKDPYAWWAGTSFAAPHITGIVANWCSQPVDARAPGNPALQSINIENVKRALRERRQRMTTDINEQVILLTQGPPPA